MPKYPYRQFGIPIDRNFRQNINDNFKDVESDIRGVQSQIDNVSVNGYITDGTVKVTSTTFLKEVNIEINLLSNQSFRSGGYYDEGGTFVVNPEFFTIFGFVSVEQNVKYNNNFYNVRCYDANGNIVGSIPNNKQSFTINDGVTVKIRPTIKVADTNIANAYMYSVGFKANNLIIQDQNIPDGVVTKNKIASNAVDYDKFDSKTQKYFKRVFDSWEYGYIGSNGELVTTSNNIRTKGYLYLEQGMKISIVNGISATFRVVSYSYSNGVYTFVSRGDLITEYVIQNSGYYKIQFQKNDLTNIDFTFGENIYGHFPELVINKVTLDAELKSEKIKPKDTEKFMHVSCDDFLAPLKDITVNASTYNSIFDNGTFAFLKSMYDMYGMVFSAYCFYESSDAAFNLSQVPIKYAKEFRDNSHWLKFGFHSKNVNRNYSNTTYQEAKEDYDMFTSNIVRITGTYKSIDLVPRLHNYAGNLVSMKALKESKGAIVGALTAEDNRINYYHNQAQTNILTSNDRMYDKDTKMMFFSTDIRLDTDSTPKLTLEARKIDSAYSNRMNDLIIFLHDPNITSAQYRSRVTECCEFAIENGYRFDFPMNVTMK